MRLVLLAALSPAVVLIDAAIPGGRAAIAQQKGAQQKGAQQKGAQEQGGQEKGAQEKGRAAGADESFRAAVAALDAARARPTLDPERYKKDPEYRRSLRKARAAAIERQRRIALRFLDRFKRRLAGDTVDLLLIRGRALNLAGNRKAAITTLKEVGRNYSKPAKRLEALVEMLDCFASKPVDFRAAGFRAGESARLRSMRSLFRKIDGAEKTPMWDGKWAGRVKEMRRGYDEARLRLAFAGLERDVVERRREVIREALEAERKKNEETDPEGGEKAAPTIDDLEKYFNPERSSASNLRMRLQRESKRIVGEFYRKNSKALDTGTGLLWKARAFLLVRERKRAAEALQGFLDATIEHEERGRVALQLAQMRAVDDERTAALLRQVDDESLDESERIGIAALRRRIDEVAAHRARSRKLIGAPLPALVPVDASHPAAALLETAGSGGAVYVFFASWSEASRRSLRALARQHALFEAAGVRVVGVTRLFGFGWRATGKAKGGEALTGQSVGPDLEPAIEREIVETLARTAALPFPLVPIEKSGLEALAVRVFPTVITVGADRKVRAIFEGVADGEDGVDPSRLLSSLRE